MNAWIEPPDSALIDAAARAGNHPQWMGMIRGDFEARGFLTDAQRELVDAWLVKNGIDVHSGDTNE